MMVILPPVSSHASNNGKCKSRLISRGRIGPQVQGSLRRRLSPVRDGSGLGLLGAEVISRVIKASWFCRGGFASSKRGSADYLPQHSTLGRCRDQVRVEGLTH